MEDMYDANAYTTSSSTGGGGDDYQSPDDISLFLNQILDRSFPSFGTPLSASPRRSFPNCGTTLVSGNGVSEGNISGNVTGNSVGNTNASSFCIGGISENETDECDWESEEGLEAFVEEEPPKPIARRSSSKRSRAAEVHNLSEKRRRSRINEKMKALQNLIPNSNKTDKASMLDEAIEYLKQLQLQVQMLSMRNGVSLHPMCLPRLLQPIQHPQFSRGLVEENNGCGKINSFGCAPSDQGNTEQTLYDLSNQLSVPSMGTDSSVPVQFNPFPLPATSGEIGRENGSSHHRVNADHSAGIPPEIEVAKATASNAFETQLPFSKGGSCFGAWTIGRDDPECVFPKNLQYSPIISPSLRGDEVKIERHHI